MNLNEFTVSRKTKIVESALKDHFEMKINFDSYNLKKATAALSKVRGLIGEVKATPAVHNSHNSPTYMKLIMLEQALVSRLEELKSVPTRIVVENEEVQKSQVILAAQDMIDSIQKMLEQVSKMNVEELDAVVNGMRSEFGSEAGDSYQATTSETLTTLQTAIQSAKTALTTALGSVTGEAPADQGMGGLGDMSGMGGMDAGMEQPGMDMGSPELGMNEPEEIEEPTDDEESVVGRGRR